MRAFVALAALTFGGPFACSLQSPTAPTVAMLTSPKAEMLAGRPDPLDISGSWVTSEFVFSGWLPGTVPDPVSGNGFVRCESYALIENEEWNSILLEQRGTRVFGTSRPGMGITCWGYTLEAGPLRWFVDIDDEFQGQVEGDEVRLALNESIEVRVKPNPNATDTWIGTIRVRMNPRPAAKPYWVEQPFALWSTTGYSCWYVHLQPPYCIP